MESKIFVYSKIKAKFVNAARTAGPGCVENSGIVIASDVTDDD